MFLYRALFIGRILLITKKINSKSIIAQKNMVPLALVLFCDVVSRKKYAMHVLCEIIDV
jgi:hypothetical protein